jgi:excisionase family DNA binding protein
LSRIAEILQQNGGRFSAERKIMESGIPTLLDPRPQPQERIAYTFHEAAQILGVHYISVYWLIQRKKLHACRAFPGKLLISRSEILRLLHTE